MKQHRHRTPRPFCQLCRLERIERELVEVYVELHGITVEEARQMVRLQENAILAAHAVGKLIRS